MLLFYIDECGDTGDVASTKSDRWFVLAAVGIHDTSRSRVAADVQLVRERFIKPVDGASWSQSEIKGSYLATAARAVEIHGHVPARAAWRDAFAGPDRGASLTKALTNVFAKHRPLVFAVVVDKKRLVEKAIGVDPLGVAYALLTERIAQVLANVIDGESALLIADQQFQHEAYFRGDGMKRARAAMSERLPRQPDSSRILDKPLWIDNDLSPLDQEIIQLADIVAYSSREAAKTHRRPEEHYYLWPAIEMSLARQWHHGGVINAGFTIFPRPDEYPPLDD